MSLLLINSSDIVAAMELVGATPAQREIVRRVISLAIGMGSGAFSTSLRLASREALASKRSEAAVKANKTRRTAAKEMVDALNAGAREADRRTRRAKKP